MTKIIVMPFSLPWNWPADYEKQTALTLARRGYKVIVYLDTESTFFLNKKLKKYPRIKNIYFHTPVSIIPFKRFKIIRLINEFINLNYLLLKFGLNKNIVLWSLNYRFFNFPKLFIKKSISIYDCVELPSSRNKKLDHEINIMNHKMIKNSDYFFVDSPTLGNYFKEHNPVVLPQGFDYKGFNKSKEMKLPMVLPFNKPIIGYIGGINYRLDYPLIYIMVKKNPQWNFVFVGNLQIWPSEDTEINTNLWIQKLKKLKNFYLYNSIPKKYMSSLIRKFSVCLIPYNTKIKFNYYSRAMKTYEYLFLNKPIISTPILESIRLSNYLNVFLTTSQFEKMIKSAIDMVPKININNKQLCFDNSWDKKILKICNVLN